MSKSNFARTHAAELLRRLAEPRRFIQVLAGARQVGKTTVARQAAERSGLPWRYASADEPTLRDAHWIAAQWDAARLLADAAGAGGALLVLDEVQKVAGADPVLWGRLTESAVGAHLANAAAGCACELFYWRDRGREVDFVARTGRKLTAVEVKSGRPPAALPGMAAFTEAFRPARTLLVGPGGIDVAAFLETPVGNWAR